MLRWMGLLLLAGMPALPALPAIVPAADPNEIRPVRLAAPAFGREAEIEVRGMPRHAARAAIEAALGEVARIERDVERLSGALNEAAGRGPQPVEPRLMTLLIRAKEFCVWSEGLYGPLGRRLYELWGIRPATALAEPPAMNLLDAAAQGAACDRLKLSASAGTAEVAEGSRLELGGFAEGYAVDRAIDILRERGAANAFAQIGRVQRAIGGGPDGRGWRILIPPFPGSQEPAARLFLRDKALAFTTTEDAPLKLQERTFLPYLSHRTGLPTAGIVGTVTVTDHALDAQALAITMAIAGPREGQLRLGSLRPNPSVLWFLGSGSGAPLQVDHRWGEVLLAR